MEHIYINGRFLSQRVTGVQRYARSVMSTLDELVDDCHHSAQNYRLVLVAPRNATNIPKLKNIHIRLCGALKGHLWEQIELPYYCRDGLLLSLCQIGPVLKKRQIVTMHDASVYAVPFAFSPVFRIWYKFLMPLLGFRAQQIVTVSDFSRRELVRYCRIKQGKITVAHEGREHILQETPKQDVLVRHNLLKRPFVLAVSSLNPNKNFSSIVKAIEILGDVDFDFVIAGGANPRVFSADIPGSESAKFIGYVDDGELRALYEHATMFLYPSFYEGFGLPPVEAMSLGCPVLVSKAASLPEVCGDAVVYCDPHSPEDIARKVKAIMADDALRAACIAKGLAKAKDYSWKNCATEIITLIERQVERRGLVRVWSGNA